VADNIASAKSCVLPPVIAARALVDDDTVEIVKASGLFDMGWYTENYKWVVEQKIDAIEHYCAKGEKNNRQPNKYFLPDWYRKKYLDSDYRGLALVHYIKQGRFQGCLPSPYFDVANYCDCVEDNPPSAENGLSHWLSSNRSVIPPGNEMMVLVVALESTGLFHEQWYRDMNPDAQQSRYSAIEHYARFGRGRKPNPYFDAAWYLRMNPHVEKSGEHPLLHYAKHGWRNGKLPSLRYAGVAAATTESRCEREPLGQYLKLISPAKTGESSVNRNYLSEPGFRLLAYYSRDCSADKKRNFNRQLEEILQKTENRWLHKIGRLETLAALFFPDHTEVYPGVSLFDRFLQFVQKVSAKVPVGTPFFNADYYRELSGSVASDSDCIREWVEQSDSTTVVPALLFQPSVYAAASGIDHSDPVELFRNFLSMGVFGKNNFHEDIDMKFIGSCGKNGEALCFADYLITEGVSFSARHKGLFLGTACRSNASVLMSYLTKKNSRNLRERLNSGALHKQILAASKFDSKVMRQGTDLPISCPPFNMILAPVVKDIRLTVVKKIYDCILLIPHCRMSGATKVAGFFSNAVADLAIDSRILLVYTDMSVYDHPEWFSESADTLDFSALSDGLSGEDRELALLDLIIGVKAQRVINFNSRLGWQVYEKYGARLATQTDLYSYLYCYDLNKDNVKVGYPSEYFVSTFSHLKSVFFDSDYLRTELTEKNRLTLQDQKKLFTLYTPVDEKSHLGESSSNTKSRESDGRTIYWAGRIDRQKNFDLVLRIAKEMTDVSFHCWGESVIGDFKISSVPVNVTIHEPYENIDELDLGECDLWLYTSLWDGIPNMLLEVGIRKVPLVTSVVWGIGDLVDSCSAWAIDDIDNEDTYIAAIRSAISDRCLTGQKVECLHNRISTRHTRQEYRKSVGDALYG